MRESENPRSAFHWRMRAEELRTMAEGYCYPDTRAILRQIAADYDRLAECADDKVALDAAMAQIGLSYNDLTGRRDRPA
jgi:hypothetical protein